jgi:hypothetical protein
VRAAAALRAGRVQAGRAGRAAGRARRSPRRWAQAAGLAGLAAAAARAAAADFKPRRVSPEGLRVTDSDDLEWRARAPGNF